MANIKEVIASIKANDSDAILNLLIESMLTNVGNGETVSEYRTTNWEQLRAWGHPPLTKFADAEYKIRQGDPDGQIELDALDTLKAAVKLRFPKT